MTDVILTGYFDPRGVLGKREVTASDTPGTRSGIILMTGAGGVLTPADAIGYPVRGLTETILATQLTDGGAAAGTFQMAGTIPAGAVLVGSKLIVNAGFAGDVSAVLIVGDGSDTDRYNTGTPDIFTTAATGIQTGVPSGNKLITTANRPTLTVTSNADITPVIAGAGSLTLTLLYIATV